MATNAIIMLGKAKYVKLCRQNNICTPIYKKYSFHIIGEQELYSQTSPTTHDLSIIIQV